MCWAANLLHILSAATAWHSVHLEWYVWIASGCCWHWHTYNKAAWAGGWQSLTTMKQCHLDVFLLVIMHIRDIELNGKAINQLVSHWYILGCEHKDSTWVVFWVTQIKSENFFLFSCTIRKDTLVRYLGNQKEDVIMFSLGYVMAGSGDGVCVVRKS